MLFQRKTLRTKGKSVVVNDVVYKSKNDVENDGACMVSKAVGK